MNVLLIYPKFADALWAHKHALEFVGKKASSPPLGLLTVAAMLPSAWEKKLVDMNVTTLSDDDIEWADYVFLSAMLAQQASATEVIARCKELGAKLVAGGPLFAYDPSSFHDIDHVVVGEAEASLPDLLADLECGSAQRVYASSERPDIQESPPPLWSLVDMEAYALMAIQFARGCPHDCEFCNVVILNGHRPRIKSTDQILAELDSLYSHGWRGHVFVCDDNFIGNKTKIKSAVLPAIIAWMQDKDYPFVLTAAASIDLADDEETMELMTKAGFDRVTIGIESPEEQSLVECNKLQNRGRDLMALVGKIQNHGLEVQGGFIIGFDSDRPSIFETQIDFIQGSGIVTAMVSLLYAFPGTRLYQRMQKENRLLSNHIGESAYGAINFSPNMDHKTLVSGHQYVLKTLYSPQLYYDRIQTFFGSHKPRGKRREKIEFNHVKLFIKSSWLLGLRDQGRWSYWKLLIGTLWKRPQSLALFVRLAVTGYHLRKDIDEYIAVCQN